MYHQVQKEIKQIHEYLGHKPVQKDRAGTYPLILLIQVWSLTKYESNRQKSDQTCVLPFNSRFSCHSWRQNGLWFVPADLVFLC